MEDTLIIKKIFINDYIINTTLLDKSLFNLLVKVLSNKFYKTDKIDYKVNHILKKIDNIFYNNSGQKIFNLAYQPFNQENIKADYKSLNFNKKWIIPVVNEKKNLNQKILEITSDNKYIDNNLLLREDDSITYYNEDEFTPYESENDFNSNITFEKFFINLLDKSSTPFEVLDDQNLFSSDSSFSSSSNTKVIREADKHTYYIYSNNIPEPVDKKIYRYNKEIRDTFNQVRNILKEENINITKFLILNPIKLLTSNYNIFIGNTMSYLSEIMYNNNNIDNNFNNYIDNIINNSQEILKNNSSFDLETEQLEYYTVDVNEFQNEYNNPKGFLWNYLKIAQNLEKISNNNEIKTIKILKHIYNIFGYDLNKIPFCYLKYIKNILQYNISNYIVENIISSNNSLLDLFNKYKLQKQDSNKNELTQLIQKLYNIQDIQNITPDNLYKYLVNNTPDNGALFYLTQYIEEYLNKNPKLPSKISLTIQENIKSEECKNYRFVKTYNSLEEYKNDINKFVEASYSEQNYLIEYADLIEILNSESYVNKNKIYQLNSLVKLDNEGKNKLDVKKDKFTEISKLDLNTFITEHKIYLYNLLFNKSDFDLDILFNKLSCFKYQNKHYIQIPIQKIQNFNIIFIVSNNTYYYIQDDNEIPIENYNDIEYINKEYIKKCESYNNTEIQIDNLKNKYNFYESLHNSQTTHIENTKLFLNNLQSKNDFYNDIIHRTQEIKESQIYFKNLPLIEYTIINYNNTSLYSNFIDNLLKLNTKFDTVSLDKLKNILNQSDELSPSIKNIKIIDQKIQQLQNKDLWSAVHRYINEYELFHTNIIENPDKHTRAYYKMRELIIDDDIIKKPNFRLISLAEAPGFFVNCIKDLVNDSEWKSYTIYTWLLDKDTTKQKNFWQSFNGHIWGANESGPINKDDITGDLTNAEQIQKIIENVGENKADLITADGGIEKRDDVDYILEEYNHFSLFLGEIITALFTQNIGGTFILKMYDISYINTINLLHILNFFYNSVKIIKPYTSRPCNSEKYIKCENFKGFETLDSSVIEKIKNNLLTILNNSKNNKKNNNYKYIDIFSNLKLDNTDILKFNENIVVKSRELYTQHIYNILTRKDNTELTLIKTYFNDTSKITNVLEDSDDKMKGYFISKIENSIRLANYLKLTHYIKPIFINFYKNINSYRNSDTLKIYPPHFSEKYEIDNEKNPYEKTPKIIKFVNKFCILFKNFGDDKILDEKILRATYLFINQSKIKIMNHPLILSISNALQNFSEYNSSELYNILINLCKKENIATTFNLYKTNTINLIIKYQNTIRYLIGWYLCKYTYLPMFPKYMIYDNVEDQIKECGIKVNSHQYICCYSGDKLDKEDFDDFMGVGENIHRTTIDIDETTSNTNLKNTTKIQNILQTGNIQNIISNLETIEHKISFYILHNIFKEKDAENISLCLSNIINKPIDITDVSNEYNTYLDLLNKQYSSVILTSKEKILKRTDYLQDISYWTFSVNKEKKRIYLPALHIKPTDLEIFKNPLIKNINKTFLHDKNKLTIHTKLNIDTFIIQHLLYLSFSNYIYNKYLSVILYTLSYINQIKKQDVLKTYTNDEKNLFKYLLENTNEFQIFKNELINKFSMPINIQNPITETTTFDDIIKQLEENQIETIKSYITPEWISFNKNIEKKLADLQKSKTVIDFLMNSNKINNLLYIKFINVLINTPEDKFDFKTNLKNYIPPNIFKTLLDNMNISIKNQPIANINNIENNIKHNRTDLLDYNILNYAKIKSTLSPFYSYQDKSVLLNYNFDSYIYYFKYLYLNVYEDDFPMFYGEKRYFKKVNNIDTCIYTKKTKNIILQELQSLTPEILYQKYLTLLNKKNKLLNKSEFINKNVLLEDNINSSLINNFCYSYSLEKIDILYKYIILFYKDIETDNDDKNIIMRFYNDPIDNIINFLKKHSELFVSKFSQFETDIIQILKLNEMDSLYTTLSKLNKINDYKIIEEINKLNIPLIEELTQNNIDIEILNNLSVNELINVIQNIKQKISYITNFSNQNQLFNSNNIEIDLKNKYKFVKNKYISESAEYIALINLVKKFYNFTLDDYRLNTLQVIFKNLLDLFHFYPNNILFTNNTNLNKVILLHKIYHIITKSIQILNNNIDVNNDYFKQRFYLHTLDNKTNDYSLIQNIPFEQPESIQITVEYKDLFKKIITDTFKSINEYSIIIREFEYNNDDDGIEDDDNFGNLQYFDEIAGSVED